MTSEEIANNNVLISHFMGLKRGDDWEIRSDKADWCHPMDLKYNTSWDWLMPVVEKIELLKVCSIVIDGRIGCEINSYNSDFSIKIGAHKIDAVHHSIVEFLKWYYEKNNIEKPKPIEFYEG